MALVRGIGLLALAAIALRVGPPSDIVGPASLLVALLFASGWLLLGLLGMWQLLVGVFALLGVGKRL